MKANELQIDDWVAYEGKNGKVKELREHKLSLKTENSVMIVYYNNVEPIPLTSEILEKNGFEYKEADETCATEAFHHWHLVGSRFAIDDDSWWCSVKDGELHVKFGGFPLKFVHQLRHALRLAGIEKTIEL